MEPQPPQRHLDEASIESYALGRLRAATLASAETHLRACPHCQRRLQELESFIATLRGAVQDFARRPIDYTHQTTLGPIRLHASRRGRRWMAIVSGGQIEYGRLFPRVYDANEFLMRAFAELFPEHRCAAECRPRRR